MLLVTVILIYQIINKTSVIIWLSTHFSLIKSHKGYYSLTINRKELFVELFNKFLEINEDVEALIVSDHQGLVIAGQKRRDSQSLRQLDRRVAVSIAVDRLEPERLILPTT